MNDKSYLSCKVKKVALKFGDYKGCSGGLVGRWEGLDELFITLDPAPRMISWWDRERLRPPLNPFASISPSVGWIQAPARIPWYRKIKAGLAKRRRMAKERREAPKVRHERLMHAEKVRRKERQR
jgi:hypothetical protein